MKTSSSVGAFIFGTLILGGCAASPVQGAQVRVRTTTAAFETHLPALAHRTKKSSQRESPIAHECKTGSSKACNELGDRLTIKHAYTEAHQWYLNSCERVRSSMVPSATHLLQLSRELNQLGEGANANPKTVAQLKSGVTEIRARIQGCLDAGETLKLDAEAKQALKYFDTACEFSTLVEAVGQAVPGFQYVAESGCVRGQSARAELPGEMPFSPKLFAQLTEKKAPPAAEKASAPPSEEGMVFNEGDL
jgi:hypothetical protein